jgi:hypothetical protein
MRNSDADIAINTLNKLARKELDIEGDAIRNDYRNLKEAPSIRFHAYTTARDEIRRALAAAANESDAENPFLPQRDELVTQDMHTCDLCGRRVSSPVYALHLAYMDQAKTASEVCADCMWRMKFQPVRAISLDMYRLFERWLDEQKETEQ